MALWAPGLRALASAPVPFIKLVLYVCLLYRIKRNLYFTDAILFEEHSILVEPDQLAVKIPLTVDRRRGSQFHPVAGESSVVIGFVQPAFDSRRRYFECVAVGNQVLDVEDNAK